jgi:hypothetical protein
METKIFIKYHSENKQAYLKTDIFLLFIYHFANLINHFIY